MACVCVWVSACGHGRVCGGVEERLLCNISWLWSWRCSCAWGLMRVELIWVGCWHGEWKAGVLDQLPQLPGAMNWCEATAGPCML